MTGDARQPDHDRMMAIVPAPTSPGRPRVIQVRTSDRETVYSLREVTSGPIRMASTRDPAGNGSAPGDTSINALAPTRDASRDDACGPVVDAFNLPSESTRTIP